MNLFPGIGDLASSLTFLCPSITGSPDISLCQAMVGRLYPTTFGGNVPRLLHRWETPHIGAFAFYVYFFRYFG